MADQSRPSSASTNKTLSYTSSSRKNSLSSTTTTRSQQSSLEDVIVKEYLDALERPSAKPHVLPRKYKSPYAETSARRKKDRRHSESPCLSSCTALQSEHVSRRSAYQDYSPLQTTSVHSRNGVSDLDLNISDSSDNPHFSSSSKKNRHSVNKTPRYSGGFGAVPVFKRQAFVIKAFAYKNGTRSMPVKVSAPTIQLLLERCTVKLKLNMAARRIFLADGEEVFEPKDIAHDTDIYISTGESFIDPFKSVKDSEILASKITWTMNGLKLPNDEKRGKTKPVMSKRIKNLVGHASVRILVFANGSGHNGLETVAMVDQMEKVCRT
ncbi:doublecortin domain-containing protein 1-like [Pelobates fuscus]|uniref:doublecortin domain-containing protein 1-like n=1 Tax=Pelobates fuscus TaxID=191477 RepID=UPI002FE486FF